VVRNTTHGDRQTGLHLVGPFRFIGGLRLPRWQQVSFPLIELSATTDLLTFRVRFGLGLVASPFIFSRSPWIFIRKEVASIKATRRKSFDPFGLGVELRMLDGQRWTFMSHNRDLVLIRLDQFGVPRNLATLVPAR
jgi:hypothetical protein